MKKLLPKIANLCLNKGGRGICSCVHKYVLVVFSATPRLNLSTKWLPELIETHSNCPYYELCNASHNN